MFAISPQKAVKVEVEKLIDRGVDHFMCGGMGQFDALCARAVKELQEIYPNLKSELVIPYLSFKCHLSHLFDSSVFPEGLEKYPYRAAILKRNEYMAANSQIALCFVNRCGGAARTYAHALGKGLELICPGAPPKIDMYAF